MEGHDLKTIEAVAENGVLSQFQMALHEEHGLQCGFCTPGIVMTIEALIGQKRHPSDEDILDALSGNLCRCTGYQNILKAIRKILLRNPAKEDPK
jgi:carbon-monoxide dehydrogenase small subunit